MAPAETPVQPGSRRFKLLLEYDGAPFCGWQGAVHGATVESVLQHALLPFHHGPDSGLRVAGRTDSGVHALGQVAHADLKDSCTTRKLLASLNGRLMQWPVSVLEVTAMPPDFHARFSAIRRRYLYRILNRRPKPALEIGRVWHVPVELSVPAMAEAAKYLLGRHDFSSFRASQCQANSPLRTLESFTVEAVGDEIHFRAASRSFLHHQVRNMVGTLVEVGRGAHPPEWVAEALAAQKRSAAGPTAPPQGLYFVGVDY